MDFGGGRVKQEIFGNHDTDINLEAYKALLAAADGPAPLTAAEHEKLALAEADKRARAEIGTQTRQSHLHGVGFPIQPEALGQLERLKRKEIMYVQLVSLRSILNFWYCDVAVMTIEGLMSEFIAMINKDQLTYWVLASRLPE